MPAKPKSYDLSLGDSLDVEVAQQRIGHHIRKPLVQIIEEGEFIFSDSQSQHSPKASTALGHLLGEAYRLLGMYDWTLMLLELTLDQPEFNPINTSAFLMSLCFDFENQVQPMTLDYRLLWHVPEALPYICSHETLLRQALS